MNSLENSERIRNLLFQNNLAHKLLLLRVTKYYYCVVERKKLSLVSHFNFQFCVVHGHVSCVSFSVSQIFLISVFHMYLSNFVQPSSLSSSCLVSYTANTKPILIPVMYKVSQCNHTNTFRFCGLWNVHTSRLHWKPNSFWASTGE